jgi:hypothetical protein
MSTSADIPGEQVLVHAAALIDQALQPSVRSLGEINIPGLFASGCVDRRAPAHGIAARDGQAAVNHPRYKEQER